MTSKTRINWVIDYISSFMEFIACTRAINSVRFEIDLDCAKIHKILYSYDQ
jgi:hypothetical protein